ncbi:hypothetical protein [Spongorhabdus nitratireducens]
MKLNWLARTCCSHFLVTTRVVVLTSGLVVSAVTVAASSTDTSPVEKMMSMPAEERAGHITDAMTSILSLTDIQKKEVNAINLRYAREAGSLMDSSGTRSEKAQKIQAMMQRKDSELKKILTPEQDKIWQDYRAKMQSKMHERMMEMGG